MFDQYLERWQLEPDGDAFSTHTSRLLPVRCNETPAILKVATAEEERKGASLMSWWAGQGAAPVLKHEGDAILMLRAEGGSSLPDMARAGQDDGATRIICEAASRLHAPRTGTPPALVELPRWFEALEPAARSHGGILAKAASVAGRLLATSHDIVVLHGDLHHQNVLDFGSRGWLAIDPKGLIGERAFDFANILRNPDQELALAPGRLARQATVIAQAAGVERERLLHWLLALSGLSAAWLLDDGSEPELDLALAAAVLEELEDPDER